ncbi:M14 family metallopeptidase [Candidatus Latescibacterota bacterium]
MKIYNKITLIILIVMLNCGLFPESPAAQKSSDPQFRVNIDFNRWHDLAELYGDMKRLEKEWPEYLTLNSIGKSHDGNDIMMMTVNNPDTGQESDKAAMYIEANIHGNEIQGGEVCLYTIWYLMENYDRIEKIKNLVDERVFYIVPAVNPDGRQYFMEGEGGDARTGHVPVDNDNDGLYDEDGPNDINGNGVIEQIRKYVPGKGTHRISHSDKRILESVPFGEKGDYIMLGSEGIDDDGDGRINEDPVGGYDPNRNWASGWQPKYIQSGSMEYPFQLPEARAVNDFLMVHPNIAGVQSFHNTGGFILRGPGSESLNKYSPEDILVYDELARNGERMLPFYRYIVLWEDFYTTYGGSIDWTNDGLGIISFANELWNGRQYFTSTELEEQRNDHSSPIYNNLSGLFFDDKLEFGDQFMDWTAFDHPDYGEVEIGGAWKKTRGRLPPRFMNEELCHRNMAFTLYQADELPAMQIGETELEKIDGDVYRIWIDITNPKTAPSIIIRAAENNVVRPDLLEFDSAKADIISVSWISNKEVQRYRHSVTSLIDQENLNRIMIRDGHPGKTTKTVQYIVKGSGKITVSYDSAKGGKASTIISLK